MNEYLHIEKAACLADKPGAEKLATRRARKFVADALANREKEEVSKSNNSFINKSFVWGGIALAIAACVAFFVVLIRPALDGVPGMLMEQQDIHSDTAVVDTTITETSDTLVIEHIIMPD